MLRRTPRGNTLYMADNIRDSGLPIQPQVSHFPFLHDPAQFNSMEGGIAERIPPFSAAESYAQREFLRQLRSKVAPVAAE